MRATALICTAAMLAALVAQARAQTAAPSDVQRLIEAEQQHPNVISGVEVRAKPRKNVISPVEVRAARKCLKARQPADPDVPSPTLVGTFPANGAVVRPGFLVLRISFDLPMACAGLLDRHALLLNPCPSPLREPVISLDKRTFLTVCHVEKSSRYGLWLRSFTSLAGHVSAPQELVFETSAEPEVATVQDAVLEDSWLRQAAQPAATPAREEAATREK